MEKEIQNTARMFSNKALFTLIWPLIVEQILNVTVGIADVIMVSSLGEASVSGVSLVDSINILLFGIFSALGTGGAVVVSQYIGRRKMDMASKTAIQLVYTMLFLSLSITVLTILFREPLLKSVFGQVEHDVMHEALDYFLITMLALPGIAVYNACAALFRAQGNSSISMMASVFINIVNVGGNAFCIYGLKMGVEGVAVPTTISRIGAAVLLFYFMLLERPVEGKKAVSVRRLFREPADFSLIKKILQIGIPNGLENSVFQIGKILVLSLIATFGTSAITANAAGNTIASIEILPPAAIGLAMLTVVGQCVGAGDYKQAMYYTKKLMAVAYISMFVWNVPLLLFSYRILEFYHLPPDTTKLAWYITLTHGIFGVIIWPMSFTLPNALRAANDARFTMIVSLISMWTIRIGMSWIFKYNGIFGLIPAMGWAVAYGALGSWFAMVLDWVLRSSLFIWRLASGKWKGRTLI